MDGNMNLPATDDEEAHRHRGSGGSNTAAPGTQGFGPGPSSPEAAASELAQLCSVLRRDFLASLQLPEEGTGCLELQAALCQRTLPAQTHEPPTAPDSTAASTREPAPRPEVPGRHRSAPTPLATPPQSARGWQLRRVGLDLGGVISLPGHGQRLVRGAVEGVARLVRDLGRDQVYIISRANSEEAARHRRAQLERTRFFKKTGFDHSNMHWSKTHDGADSKGPQPSPFQIPLPLPELHICLVPSPSPASIQAP